MTLLEIEETSKDHGVDAIMLGILMALPGFIVTFAIFVYALFWFCCYGNKDFQRIEYLICMCDLEASCCWKLLIVCAGVAILPTVILSSVWQPYLLVNFLLIAMSLRRLMTPSQPIIHWAESAVGGLRLRRPWASLFFETNDQCALKLVRALYHDQLGHRTGLEAMLVLGDAGYEPVYTMEEARAALSNLGSMWEPGSCGCGSRPLLQDDTDIE